MEAYFLVHHYDAMVQRPLLPQYLWFGVHAIKDIAMGNGYRLLSGRNGPYMEKQTQLFEPLGYYFAAI